MTKPLIKLPSVELREAWEALDKIQAELADKQAEIANKEAEIAGKDAEIAQLRKLLLEATSSVPQI